MSKIIVFGSLNMDLSIACERLPRSGETVTGSGFIINPGGKGANQAVAAARLGADVCLLGAVGPDLFGRQLKDGLIRAGVDCAHLSTAPGFTTGVALITRSAGDNRIVLDPGANHALGASDVDRALEDAADPGDVFLTQLECEPDATFSALADAHRRGLACVFNPAPARDVPHALWSAIDTVCLNETECEALTGIMPDDPARARRAMGMLASWGARTVALTLGAKGSLVLDGGELWESVPPTVDAVDTTGAGDTYIGALAMGLARGMPLVETLRWATCASALATTGLGAQQAVPSADEVASRLSQPSFCPMPRPLT